MAIQSATALATTSPGGTLPAADAHGHGHAAALTHLEIPGELFAILANNFLLRDRVKGLGIQQQAVHVEQAVRDGRHVANRDPAGW